MDDAPAEVQEPDVPVLVSDVPVVPVVAPDFGATKASKASKVSDEDNSMWDWPQGPDYDPREDHGPPRPEDAVEE